MLGLPAGVTTCLFDLDGVLTDTASVHDAAWKEMFDAFLRARAERDGAAFVPFDRERDYETYVDGKPRLAVDIGLIVALSIERHERCAVTLGAGSQKGIEHLLPRGIVHRRGVGEHTVQVEQTRRDTSREP